MANTVDILVLTVMVGKEYCVIINCIRRFKFSFNTNFFQVDFLKKHILCHKVLEKF